MLPLTVGHVISPPFLSAIEKVSTLKHSELLNGASDAWAFASLSVLIEQTIKQFSWAQIACLYKFGHQQGSGWEIKAELKPEHDVEITALLNQSVTIPIAERIKLRATALLGKDFTQIELTALLGVCEITGLD